MIVPKEKPYMDGLNSYYLDTVKFIGHLQGEIGNGCIYLKSSVREILIYFDEMDIINGVVQESGQQAEVAPSLKPIFEFLQQRNYMVKVFQFDPSAIFFWAQMPPYKRAQADSTTTKNPLPELIQRLNREKASCFVEMELSGNGKSCILFFHQGEYVGASYSWGAGGLNPSKDELNTLIELTRHQEAVLTMGFFENGDNGSPQVPEEEQPPQDHEPLAVEDQVFISNLPTILEEFFNLYISIAKKKVKVDPVSLLEQRIVVRADDFPFLDPFNLPFEFSGSIFTFTGNDNAFGENTAKAIIDCAWDVVMEYRLGKKFKAALKKWPYRPILEEREYLILK